MIEVLAAVLVLVTGLIALLGMLVVGNHATAQNRERQAATSLAREVVEDVRSLPYSEIIQSSLTSTLQTLIPTSSVSGSTLIFARSGGSGGQNYTFDVTVTECSLDDPSDGYGSHTQSPVSGGSWCPDVASSGTNDTNPDDYKRIVVKVTPRTNSTLSSVQQTVLVYSEGNNGPAVSCLSTTSSCPGSNITVTSSTQTSLTFNLTATQTPAAVEWLVNGARPPSSQIPTGANDPYSTTSKSSTFTWNFPTTTTPSGTGTIDGTYTIGAVAYDANGNAGTQSTLQVTVNEHQAIAPASLTAGWNAQISGAEISWTPSVDQDIQYYNVYHYYGASGASTLACSHVTTSSCYDLTAISPLPATEPSTCSTSTTTYAATSNNYYVVGVDTNSGTGAARESTWQSTPMNANYCDHPPNAPSSLSGTASSGSVALSWTAPSDSDSGWDKVIEYRIYRWPSTSSVTYPGSRYTLVGATSSSGGAVTSYTDSSADPSGVTQSYCVTAVDTHLDESPCSNVVSG